MRFPFLTFLFSAAIQANIDIDSDTSYLARYFGIIIKLFLIPSFVLGGILTLAADIVVNIIDAVISITNNVSKARFNHTPEVTDVPISTRVWNMTPYNLFTSMYNRYKQSPIEKESLVLSVKSESKSKFKHM